MFDLPVPTAVVCHDAGAANVIIAAIHEELAVSKASGRFLPVMQGPAVRIWESSGIMPSRLLTLEEALPVARSVLSGTGWASNLEHEARRRARELGLPSASFIDHWVNYEARFERVGNVVLPDTILVGDSDALAIAARTFPGVALRQVPNLYLRREVAAIAAAAPPVPSRILYVLEPLRYSWPGASRAAEFDALDYFIANIDKLGSRSDWSIRLRPHPSDPAGKYETWMAKQHGMDVGLDRSPSLAMAIGEAEWVAGCETTALVIALNAGRKVISTLPPAAPTCRLPQTGLLHLRSL